MYPMRYEFQRIEKPSTDKGACLNKIKEKPITGVGCDNKKLNIDLDDTGKVNSSSTLVKKLHRWPAREEENTHVIVLKCKQHKHPDCKIYQST